MSETRKTMLVVAVGVVAVLIVVAVAVALQPRGDDYSALDVMPHRPRRYVLTAAEYLRGDVRFDVEVLSQNSWCVIMNWDGIEFRTLIRYENDVVREEGDC